MIKKEPYTGQEGPVYRATNHTVMPVNPLEVQSFRIAGVDLWHLPHPVLDIIAHKPDWFVCNDVEKWAWKLGYTLPMHVIRRELQELKSLRLVHGRYEKGVIKYRAL